MQLTNSELGRRIGISRQRVTVLIEEGVIDLSKELDACILDYCAHLRELAARWKAERTDYDLGRERARLTRSQANRSELEERQLTGELIAAKDVEQWLASLVLNCRAHLLALPTRLATVAMAATSLPEIESSVRDEIHTALNELGDAGVALFEQTE